MFISYFFGADLSQLQYIICDFLFYFPVVLLMVKSKAADELRGNPPTYKIFGPTTLWSILTPLVLLWITSGIVIAALNQQTWFVPNPVGTIAIYQIPETTSLFLINVFFLCGTTISWSFGSKYRQPIWKNVGLLLSILGEILVIIGVYVIPIYSENFRNFMEMVVIPSDFLLELAGIGVIAWIVLIFFEYICIIGPVAKYFRKKTGRGRPKPNLNPLDVVEY